MKRLIPVLILLILISSCKKSVSDFIWEKSYGKGEALFIKATPDSGFVSCGELQGNPYLIRLSKNRSLVAEFKGENPGLFSSVWFDTAGYITGGSTDGKMLLMHLSAGGSKLWEKSFDAGFKVDYTNILYTGNGNLLAIGTASPDSSGSGTTGLFFVRFDTTGQIILKKKFPDPLLNFLSANQVAMDNAGNLYFAFTRRTSGYKAKASVAKFNDQLSRIWEADLYNNPESGAASLAVKTDPAGNLYVAGNTEVSTKDGKLNNSFVVSLTNSGAVRWKKYLENSNYGSALLFNDAGELMMLNKNCFIINILSTPDGLDAGRIKMLSICDSYSSDALGAGFDINFEKNILIAGTYGGTFYLALKSSQ